LLLVACYRIAVTEDSMITQDLLHHIQSQYALRLEGIHGLAHWQRVCENGLCLAAETGADAAIVEFFAFLHDACRQSDGRDHDHGPRAAALVRSLQGTLLHLRKHDLELLAYACEHHTRGLIEADLTVQVCWAADRLDLGRIGIRPNPVRLCTPVARDPALVEWAWRRSRGDHQGGGYNDCGYVEFYIKDYPLPPTHTKETKK
jgi:uncharacterized protein